MLPSLSGHLRALTFFSEVVVGAYIVVMLLLRGLKGEVGRAWAKVGKERSDVELSQGHQSSLSTHLLSELPHERRRLRWAAGSCLRRCMLRLRRGGKGSVRRRARLAQRPS